MVAQGIVYEFASSGGMPTRDRDGPHRAARPRRRADRGARARPARRALRRAGGRLLHVGRAARGRRRRRALRRRRRARRARSSRAPTSCSTAGDNTLRLAYSGVTPKQIDEGVSRLAEAYNSLSGDAGGGVGLSARSVARDHELLGQRDARRRRGVGDDRHGLGDRAVDRDRAGRRPRTIDVAVLGRSRSCPRGRARCRSSLR